MVTGFVAGIMTSTVGVASLLSFPVLVAVGLPPVVANASNTVGMTPAGLTGSFGYRSELRAHPWVTAAVLGTCGVGAVLGAFLLLALPPGVFEAVVPWLILGTCLLVGAQPRISAWLRRSREVAAPDVETRLSGPTTFFSTLVGVYGGYFGAGSGVMMTAVLGLRVEPGVPDVNALKTLAVTGEQRGRERHLRVRRGARLAGGRAAGLRLRRRRVRRRPHRPPAEPDRAALADRAGRRHRRGADAPLAAESISA